MQLYDPLLGQLEVEIEVGFPTIEDSHIIAGYFETTFIELNDQELDYLNEKYKQDIVSQAIMILTKDPSIHKEIH